MSLYNLRSRHHDETSANGTIIKDSSTIYSTTRQNGILSSSSFLASDSSKKPNNQHISNHLTDTQKVIIINS